MHSATKKPQVTTRTQPISIQSLDEIQRRLASAQHSHYWVANELLKIERKADRYREMLARSSAELEQAEMALDAAMAQR